MEFDEMMSKVVADLEYCIGSECYNPNSYDGWNDISGCEFRYPVMVPVEDEEEGTSFIKIRDRINQSWYLTEKDINPTSMSYMKYKFGSNELFVGMGIKKVLRYLEKRYGLDFNELERKYQEEQAKTEE